MEPQREQEQEYRTKVSQETTANKNDGLTIDYVVDTAIAPTFGPLIGGSLVDWDLFGSGWRLVFLVNVPIGVAAVLFGLRLLPHSERDRSIRLDLGGSALVGLFAVFLVYPLIEGRDHGWPWWTYTSMAVGVIPFCLGRGNQATSA